MKNLSLQLLFAALLAPVVSVLAQQTFPAPAPTDERSGLHAFTNATIFIDYKTRLEGATLLIRDGKVVGAGASLTVPADAVQHDCSGKTIYPSFIDIYAADYGLPVPSNANSGDVGGGRFGQSTSGTPASDKKGGAFSWNEALRPEYSAATLFNNDPKAAEEYRKLGFGTLLTHRADGISRGTGALVLLGDGREHELILNDKASHFLSFRKGSSRTPYPTSLMGTIALIRQTYLDAQWYKTEGSKTEKNLSLDAWNTIQGIPQIFEAGEKLDILRIARIGEEFGVKYIVKSAGDDYQRLSDIVKTGYPLIVPLQFPEGYDVRDPYDALQVSLRDLKHWEMAPSNPSRLQASGVPFCLTTNGLKDKSKFFENLRKAIEQGLEEETALKALTFNPATFINAYAQVGSLEPGKVANFIITSAMFSNPTLKFSKTGPTVKVTKSAPINRCHARKWGVIN